MTRVGTEVEILSQSGEDGFGVDSSKRQSSRLEVLENGPKVSVIIVNYNGMQVLAPLLDSLKRQTFSDFETLVVDNGSHDSSVSFIQRNFNWVRVVQNSENTGFAAALNRGIELSSGEYVMMLNNDVVLESRVLEALSSSLQADSKIAIIQPKIRSQINKDAFDYAGAAGGYIDFLGYPFCRGRVFDTIEKDHGQYDNPCYTFWAGGAAFMVRRNTLKRIGMLDTQFVMYHEETDLCWRAQLAGFKVACNPSTSVYHMGSYTFKTFRDEYRFFFMHRNSFHLLFKYYSRPALLAVIPTRTLFEFVNVLFALFNRRPAEAKSILRAFGSLISQRRIVLTELRTGRTRASLIPKGLPIYPRPIVFDYFLLGKRTWSALFSNGGG
jgi:GT2 family glycosyltransferase